MQSGKETCGGSFLAAVTFDQGPTLSGQLRQVALGEVQIPFAVFFLTSFGTSILYYFGIFCILIGCRMYRVTNIVFSTSYLKSDKYQFTFICSILFVVAELIRVIILNI